MKRVGGRFQALSASLAREKTREEATAKREEQEQEERTEKVEKEENIGVLSSRWRKKKPDEEEKAGGKKERGREGRWGGEEEGGGCWRTSQGWKNTARESGEMGKKQKKRKKASGNSSSTEGNHIEKQRLSKRKLGHSSFPIGGEKLRMRPVSAISASEREKKVLPSSCGKRREEERRRYDQGRAETRGSP